MTTRSPAVAGMFYEAEPGRLRTQLDRCFGANERAAAKTHFIGAIVPHAGLMYSGHVAAALYDRVVLPKRIVILCPNHTGAGRPVAINRRGSWRMPFGEMRIDEALADEIKAASPLVEDDEAAHRREHSLEVQLPFVQRLAPDAKFVPICVSLRRFDEAASLGEAIATVVASHRDREEEIAIIASSDMNHYEDQETTLAKDQMAIDAILALDARSLWDTVVGRGISMCGFMPSAVMLAAAKRLGASGAQLVKHATSGDVSGDYDAVVGYASIIVT